MTQASQMGPEPEDSRSLSVGPENYADSPSLPEKWPWCSLAFT